jgi:hypothetical protein
MEMHVDDSYTYRISILALLQVIFLSVSLLLSSFYLTVGPKCVPPQQANCRYHIFLFQDFNGSFHRVFLVSTTRLRFMLRHSQRAKNYESKEFHVNFIVGIR